MVDYVLQRSILKGYPKTRNLKVKPKYPGVPNRELNAQTLFSEKLKVTGKDIITRDNVWNVFDIGFLVLVGRNNTVKLVETCTSKTITT